MGPEIEQKTIEKNRGKSDGASARPLEMMNAVTSRSLSRQK